jgi:chromosome segregation ATPase
VNAPFVPELTGPEDTRYFEDESNEMKKYHKQNLAKTKEFSGNSLAFVGYNFVHNSTAEIRYPGFVSRTNTVNSSSGGFAEYQEFQAQIQQLKDAKNVAEGEIQSLKKEKFVFESELNKLKSENFHVLSENKHIADSLKKMRDELNSTREQLGLAEQILDAKERLESENKVLKEKFKSEQARNLEAEIRLSELKEERTNLLEMSESVQLQYNTALAEKDSVESKLNRCVLQVSSQNAEIDALKTDIDAQSKEIEKLNQDILEKNSAIQQRIEEICILKDLITKFEKQQLVSTMDKENYTKQISTLEEEKLQLQRNLSESVGSHGQKDLEEINSLKLQLSLANTAKTNMAEMNSELSKNNALLEMELSGLTKKLTLLESEKKELESAQQKLSQEKDDYFKKYESMKKQLSFVSQQLKESQIELNRIKHEKQDSVDNLSGLQSKLSELDNSQRTLKKEYLELQIKYQTEQRYHSELQEKISGLELQFKNERATRIAVESEKMLLSTRLEEDLGNVHRLQIKFDYQKEKLEKEICGLKEELALLETSLKITTMNYASEKNLREEESEQFKSKLDKQKEIVKKEIKLRENLEDQLKNARVRLADLQEENNRERKRVSDLLDRIDDLEAKVEGPSKEQLRSPTLKTFAQNTGGSAFKLLKRSTILKSRDSSTDKLGGEIKPESENGSPENGEMPEISGEIMSKSRSTSWQKSNENIADKKPEREKLTSKIRRSGLFFSKSRDSMLGSKEDDEKKNADHKRGQSRQSMLSLSSVESLKIAIEKTPKHSKINLNQHLNSLILLMAFKVG